MNRRNFIKIVPTLTATPLVLGNTTSGRAKTSPKYPQGTDHLKLKYPYFVNCYIQNQKYWPLEEYKKGIFGGLHEHSKSGGFMGEKWIKGQLCFYSFQSAVEFISIHSQVVEFETELAYEVFHERSQDPLVAPKHIYNYWAKLNPFKETKWIHPDYIDHTADGALIEYI